MKNMLRHQRGASLLIVLLMLVVVMLFGVSAAQLSLMNEKSSRNDRDRHIAFQAAEAGLRDAERDIAGGRITPEVFPDQAGACHGVGAHQGLCLATVNIAPWRLIDFSAAAPSVRYGQFTGISFPHGAASLPAQPPRYLIELLRLAATDRQVATRYRVTAVGFGPRRTTQVMLQTVLDAAPPSRRLSWREVNN
jgi:type IV pilus assembly protein PilX